MQECLTCGWESDNRKDFFDLAAKTGPHCICRKCASELGLNNFMSAGFHSNTGVLKKYVKIHPEAQYRLDAQLERLEKYKANIQAELKQMNKKSNRHTGCKKKKQTKCSCSSCGNVFYYASSDELSNAANLLNGSLYGLNNVKDLKKCPKCGSRAVSTKTVYFWMDRNGKCVDVEE